MDQFDAQVAQIENDMKVTQERQTARIVELRQERPIKKTVYLDPRELETPHILCLGPPEKPLGGGPSVPPSRPAPHQPQPNVLDELSHEDVQAPCLVPSSVQR